MVVRGCSFANGTRKPFEGLDALKAILADPAATVWVDVAASADVAVDPITELLELHPLIATDIAERNQRAKVAEVEGTIHIVMFWIAFEGAVTALEIDLVLGKRLLLTVHEPAWDPFSLPQLRGDGTALLARGPDFLLYAITDGIVDGYFPVLDAIEDEIDEIQDAVIARPTTWTLERLFTLKRELISLRRAISPAREIFNQLTNRDQAADRGRPHRLLPRRVRPPDPRDRRARHRPRAGRRDARGLPVDDQQQPVHDHEAPDRRHRDPRRHRGGRRDLRHERGRHGPGVRRGQRVLDHHGLRRDGSPR